MLNRGDMSWRVCVSEWPVNSQKAAMGSGGKFRAAGLGP